MLYYSFSITTLSEETAFLFLKETDDSTVLQMTASTTNNTHYSLKLTKTDLTANTSDIFTGL